MTPKRQEDLFQNFVQLQYDILIKKRGDYANEDVLSNFKQVGDITGLDPAQSILVLIATKVARLGNLLKGKVPNNESIDDTIVDMANYCFLLYAVREDLEILKIRPDAIQKNYTEPGIDNETKEKIKRIIENQETNPMKRRKDL